jgi:hypothetical protein
MKLKGQVKVKVAPYCATQAQKRRGGIYLLILDLDSRLKISVQPHALAALSRQRYIQLSGPIIRYESLHFNTFKLVYEKLHILTPPDILKNQVQTNKIVTYKYVNLVSV